MIYYVFQSPGMRYNIPSSWESFKVTLLTAVSAWCLVLRGFCCVGFTDGGVDVALSAVSKGRLDSAYCKRSD